MKTVINCTIQEGISISVKSKRVVDYIKELPEGSKISVRELSATLEISEGTAYKGVKEAEQQGLVSVRSKSGTVRISTESSMFKAGVPAKELARHLSLSVLSEKESLDRSIHQFLICDGSREKLVKDIEKTEAESCICLCGDRADLQEVVLECGANLLLTGGAKASWALMTHADKKGALILASERDSLSVIQLLQAVLTNQNEVLEGSKVEDWMQTPDYLYYNDIIADWQQQYFESGFIKQYPIVDDNLEIYGGIDLWKAASSVPSQKLRSALAEKTAFSCVSCSESPDQVARAFVAEKQALAAVVDGKKLLGIVTATDLLRYYMYCKGNSIFHPVDSFLVKDTDVSNARKLVFRIRVPENEIRKNAQMETELMLSAAYHHLRELGYSFSSIISAAYTGYERVCCTDELMLNSECRRIEGNTIYLDMEINDDRKTFTRAFFVVSGQKTGEE